MVDELDREAADAPEPIGGGAAPGMAAALAAVGALAVPNAVADLTDQHRALQRERKRVHTELRNARRRENALVKKARRCDTETLLGIVASRLQAAPKAAPKAKAASAPTASANAGSNGKGKGTDKDMRGEA
jgi:hypothetical protein